MNELLMYANYFIGGSGQLPILLGAFAVLAGLAAIGRAMFAGRGLAEADLFGGWAVAVLVFTVGNVFFRIPFSYVFWVFAAAGGGLALWYLYKERRAGPAGFWRVVILAAPLLLIASARMASEWDEFSHWLPTARFIFEAQQFPFGGREVSGGHFPGYPFGWMLLVYSANMTAGQFVESAGSTLNILLLLTFGVGAVRMWCEATDNPIPDVGRLTWTGALFAVLAATLLNPTFVQKVIMTTYADASTAVAMGGGAVLAYFVLDALANKETERARVLAWQFGLAMAVLINIKQANLVITVLLLGASGLVALRDRAIPFGAYLRVLPAMVLPAVAIYGIWRYHVAVNLPSGVEANFLPYEKWNLDLLWPIFERMLIVAGKKIGYFGVLAIAAVFALRALWRCETRFDRVAMLTGLTFVGYNAFLFMIFVTHFTEYDALRVASYWRYNHHLGLTAVVFGAFALGTLYRRYLAGKNLQRYIVPVLFAVVIAAPFVFAEKLRFDTEHPKPFFRNVGAELLELLPEGSRVFLLDPYGSGESVVLTGYSMHHRRSELLGYMATFHPFSAKSVRQVIDDRNPGYLLVHSVRPSVNRVLGTDLAKSGYSYLLRKIGDDPVQWEIVKKWSRPDSYRIADD
ncbi:MAG: hypothetical protein ACFE0S_16905 [Rhodospirillales bacterium]